MCVCVCVCVCVQLTISHLFQIYPYNQIQKKGFLGLFVCFFASIESCALLLLLPLVENVLFSYLFLVVGIAGYWLEVSGPAMAQRGLH